MAKKISQTHYETKLLNTVQKHELFTAVLETSFAIANQMNKNDSFAYFDLFAGRGKFDDESEGSPIISLRLLEKLYNDEKITFSFDNVQYLLCEKDQINLEILNNEVEKNYLNKPINKHLKIDVLSGEYQQYFDKIKLVSESAKWGFIFADPFATQLKLSQFKQPFMNNLNKKDLLFFINVDILKRLLGTNIEKNMQIIADYFDVDLEVIKTLKSTDIETEEVVQTLIFESFKRLGKDLVINVGLSRENKNKNELENSDRYYLCLVTSSVGVANAYLKKYSDLIVKYKSEEKFNLFTYQEDNAEFFNLYDKINEIIKNKQKLYLIDLIYVLYNDFHSWKNAHEKEIPTCVNIRKTLNSLIKENEISIITDVFINQKEKQKLQKKLLTTKAFDSKSNLSQVQIKSN